jgi:hypothetical protein
VQTPRRHNATSRGRIVDPTGFAAEGTKNGFADNTDDVAGAVDTARTLTGDTGRVQTSHIWLSDCHRDVRQPFDPVYRPQYSQAR